MSEVGKKFKAEREKRGISIQEVGLSLKINPRVIAAIENGERETLPAKTFLRGFVKSYAQFLRMDAKDIMEEFGREYGMETPNVPKPAMTTDATAPTPDSEKNTAATEAAATAPTVATTSQLPQQRSLSDSASIAKENIATESGFPVGKVILGVILFAAVVFLAKTVDKYQRERVLPTDEAAATADENTDTPVASENGEDAPMTPGGTTGLAGASTGSLEALTSVTGALTASTTAASTPASTPTPSSSPTPSPSPSPTATPKATPTPTPTPSPTPKASPSPSPTATPTPKPSPSPTAGAAAEALSRPIEVIVEASKSVRVRYDLGNGQWTTIDLAEGGLHTFRSKNPVSLDIADGGAVSLIVNGRDRGKPGPSGQPVQLRLRE